MKGGCRRGTGGLGWWWLAGFLLLFGLADGVRGQTVENRIALVIGNGAYRQQPLPNPVADARLMEEVLRESGFDVIRAENVSLREMRRLVREFGVRLRRSGGVGLFYFAGHGVQLRGENYLISTDSDLRHEEEIADDSLSAQSVLERMEAAGNRVNIVILDACRNNPFPARVRAIGGGLATMTAPAGSLVAFSTAPGSVASDGGAGPNGLFTMHLAQSIREPGLRIEEVLKRTRAAVLRDSNNQQTPWENSALLGDFYFKPPRGAPPAATAPVAAAPSPLALELAFWESIKNSEQRVEFEEYLKRFPEGTFSGLARGRIAALERPVQPTMPERLWPPPVEVAAAPERLAPATTQEAVAQLSAALALVPGDRLRFRDADPISGAQTGTFWREVTFSSDDRLNFDYGQLVVARTGSIASRTSGAAELIEDGYAFRAAPDGEWSGQFMPASRQWEAVPLRFRFDREEKRVIDGVEWKFLRVTVRGFASRVGVVGLHGSTSAAIRGHAWIDEKTGLVVEFDLRSEHPQYALRRQLIDTRLGPR